MASVEVDFVVEQGASYAFSLGWGTLVENGGVPVLDVDGLQEVDPYDLTGCGARMQMKFRTTGPALLTVTDTDHEIVLVGPAALAVTHKALASNVATLTLGTHG